MDAFAQDPNISQPPPIEIEFVDHLDNRWRLGSDRALTLLTPRLITALPSGMELSQLQRDSDQQLLVTRLPAHPGGGMAGFDSRGVRGGQALKIAARIPERTGHPLPGEQTVPAVLLTGLLSRGGDAGEMQADPLSIPDPGARTRPTLHERWCRW